MGGRAWLGAVCLALAACGGGPDERVSALPDVFLISIDTLRADHLSCYGYALETSPHLDAFAAGATRWSQALSTAPWTLPSHASMFTGLFPYEHGARTLDRKGPGSNAPALPDEHTTLAEVLRAAGYRTEALVANEAFLAKRYRLDQGFDTWVARPGRAEALHKRLFPRLEQAGREAPRRPLFLFLNYMDTHRPYNSVERPGFLPRPVGRDSAALLDELYAPVLRGAPLEASPEMQRVVDMYDTSIANLDEQLGALFAKLRELGRFEGSLILITSDHGEYFGEHALIEHSKDVYQGALAVPLLLKLPGQTEGRVVREPLSLTAIPELVLDALPSWVRAEHGRRLPDARAELLAENYYSRRRDLDGQAWGDRFQRVRRALREGDFKYVQSSDGADELYDLAADPGERVNLIEAEPERARAMRERLQQLVDRPRTAGRVGEPVELSAEDEANLRHLGYAEGE